MEFPTIDKFAKEVAEKSLDEITYEGKTIREWAELLVKQQPCEDAISRAEALRHSHIEYDDDGEGHRVIYTEDIEELPPVTPERPKTGHWIDTGSGQECSECGEIQYGYDTFRFFCANCGAEMSGGGEDGK